MRYGSHESAKGLRSYERAAEEIISIIAALMIKPVFHIETSEVNADSAAQSTLTMEISEFAFTYLVTGSAHNVIAAAYFVLPERDDMNQAYALREIIYGQEILQHEFERVIVLYNFSDGTLVPDEMYKRETEEQIADVLFGSLRTHLVLNEKHDQGVARTIYRVPQNIHNLMQQKFAGGNYWHIYSLWLRAMKDPASAASHVMELIFASDKMLVALFKEGQLQLLQSVPYSTPEDVAYALLNYCHQLDFSTEECMVYVSGYIDEDSALFNELKKYFLKLQFTKMIGSEEERIGEYPVHYFSYLQKIAACVS